MPKSKKGKLQAVIVLEFYENATTARIEKGFVFLNPGKIQRGLKQMFAAYHYERREVLRRVNKEQSETSDELVEERANG